MKYLSKILAEAGIITPYADFDTTTTTVGAVGRIKWNDSDGTIDVGLKGGNVTLQVGQEQVIRVVNKTGATLSEANYQAVYLDGAQGQRPKVSLAKADSDLTSASTIGLVTETIADNQEGFVTSEGIVRGINTTGSLQGETWVSGDILYLSPTTAGAITNIKPVAPQHMVVIGYLIYAHATQGKILVKVNNGYELDELHNVLITTPADKNLFAYEASSALWKNKSFADLGLISGSGSANKIAKFGSGGTNIVDSLISESGITVSVDGKFRNSGVLSNRYIEAYADGGYLNIGSTNGESSTFSYKIDNKSVFQESGGGSTYMTLVPNVYWTRLYIEATTIINDNLILGSGTDDGVNKLQVTGYSIATGYRTPSGTSSQFLKADGSTDNSSYALSSAISGTTGKLSKFTASGTIGDSIVSESANRIKVQGSVVVDSTTGSYSYFLTQVNNVNTAIFGSDAGIYGGNANDFGVYVYGNNKIQLSTNGTYQMVISDGKIITNNATDTGESFIVGGSARVNGAVNINGDAVIGAVLTLRESVSLPAAFAMTNRNSNQTWGFAVDTGVVDDKNFGLYNISSGNFPFVVAASTGAATFSSTVTAAGLIASSGNNVTITTGDLQILSNAGYGILSADGNRVVSIQNGAFGVTGAATFSSSVAGISFTANSRTTLYSGGILDSATGGNNMGIAFGGSAMFSTNGAGALTPINLGDITNPWGNIFGGAATFSSSVTATQGIFGDGSQGLIARAYTGGSGYGGIYAATLTPSGTNYALLASSSNTFLNAPSGGNVYLSIANSAAMTVTSSGNVGIGTTSPSSLLAVNGDIRVLSGYGLALNRPDNGAQSSLYTNAGNELILATAIGGTITLGNSVSFSGDTIVNGVLALNLGNYGTNSYHQLNRNALTTENMFKWSTGGTGKWWLGQRSKNSEDGFSLYSSAISDDILYFNPAGNTVFYGGITWGKTSGTYMYAGGASHKFAYSNSAQNTFYSGGTKFTINNQADTAILFDILDSGAATFNVSLVVGASSNGRLGVRGTTNDSSAYAFEAANSSGNSLFLVRNDGAATFSNNVAINNAVNTGYQFIVNSTTGVYNTLFTSSLTGTSNYNVTVFTANFTSAIGYMGIGGGTAANTSFRDNFVIGTQTNHNLVFNTNDSTKAVLFAGGNFVIGTTTDDGSHKLQVAGTMIVAGANEVTRISSSTTTLYNAYAANSVDVGYIGNGNGLVSGGSATDFGMRAENNLLFAIGNSTKLFIASSGAVTLSTIANATTDTDKFLVSDSGTIKYRTGAEVLSDIGGIANQFASAQTADFWISGDAKVNSRVYIGTNGCYIQEVLVGSTYELRAFDSAGNSTILT